MENIKHSKKETAIIGSIKTGKKSIHCNDVANRYFRNIIRVISKKTRQSCEDIFEEFGDANENKKDTNYYGNYKVVKVTKLPPLSKHHKEKNSS